MSRASADRSTAVTRAPGISRARVTARRRCRCPGRGFGGAVVRRDPALHEVDDQLGFGRGISTAGETRKRARRTPARRAGRPPARRRRGARSSAKRAACPAAERAPGRPPPGPRAAGSFAQEHPRLAGRDAPARRGQRLAKAGRQLSHSRRPAGPAARPGVRR
jgi:hypothetical protein